MTLADYLEIGISKLERDIKVERQKVKQEFDLEISLTSRKNTFEELLHQINHLEFDSLI